MPPQVEKGKVSVFLWSWTLQFLAIVEMRRELVAKSAVALHPEGFIFVGEKFVNSDPGLNQVLQDGYVAWRVENGYSASEIKAKNKALSGAMWPWTHEDLHHAAEKCGLRIRCFYSQFNFGGYVLSR